MKEDSPLATLAKLMAVVSLGAGIYGIVQDTQPKITPPQASQTIVYMYVVVPAEPTAQPTTQPTSATSVENPKWQVARPPTTNSKTIEAEFVKYNSPLTGLGKYIYDLGRRYGVDPNFFMSIAYLESIYGTTPSIALANHNPGSLRASLLKIKVRYNFAYFNTWNDGIEAWYRHMVNFYFAKNLTSVDTIIPVYAPPIENDTVGYITKVKQRMDALRTPPSQ